MTNTSSTSNPPFTVVKGDLDDAETEAVGQALAVLVAEGTARTSTDPREIDRLRARAHSRGHWGSPTKQFNRSTNFNPTGFRG